MGSQRLILYYGQFILIRTSIEIVAPFFMKMGFEHVCLVWVWTPSIFRIEIMNSPRRSEDLKNRRSMALSTSFMAPVFFQ